MIDLGEYGAGFTRDPIRCTRRCASAAPSTGCRTPQPGAYEGWLVVGYEEARLL